MKCNFLDESGKPQLMEMGCYGIGVTRIVAAAIEQNHDERGIICPAAMAPFAVAIVPIGYDRSDAVRDAADKLHDELPAAGFDVLLDDRGERPGAMFADLELIGIPHRIVVGERGLKDGTVEYQGRARCRGEPGHLGRDRGFRQNRRYAARLLAALLLTTALGWRWPAAQRQIRTAGGQRAGRHCRSRVAITRRAQS